MPAWVPVLLLEVIAMGRQVRRNLVGTREAFEKSDLPKSMVRIDGAEVYWGDNTIAVVAPQEWCDYLHGKTDTIPQPQSDDRVFSFDEREFFQLIGIQPKTWNDIFVK